MKKKTVKKVNKSTKKVGKLVKPEKKEKVVDVKNTVVETKTAVISNKDLPTVEKTQIDYTKSEIKADMSSILNDNMMEYSLSVIVARALPDVIDGLMPGPRLFIWGAKQAHADGEKTIKSATIVGETMGKYHPHGDASIYKAGCRLVDSRMILNLPFISGQGGFGKFYDELSKPSASRYTEMKLSPFSKDLIDDCGKYHESNMIPNFDGTLKQPKYLSAPFPQILVNAQEGIAVGYACQFGSFNLNEVCEACKIVIKNLSKSSEALFKDIYKVMPSMDFTTGGETCLDEEQIKSVYLTGRGAIPIRAVFENNQKERRLDIIEIPYSTTIQAIMKAVIKAVDSGKLSEVSDIKNLSGKKGFRIGIDYKTGTDVEELKKKLFALTPCQSVLNANMNVIVNNSPQLLGVIDCIKKWVEHRKSWVTEGLQGKIAELENQLHLLQALQQILLDIDKAIKIVRNSKTDPEVISGLKKAFKIDDIQAEFVANIKLRHLNKDYLLNKIKEIKDLQNQIKDLKNRLKDIDTELINDLDAAKKKYGFERRTKIYQGKWEELPTFKVNSKEPVKLDGESIVFCGVDTVKRVPVDSGAKAPNNTTKWDKIPNENEILIFTNTAKCFKWVIGKLQNNNQVKVADIKQIKKKLEAGEQIIYICPLIEKNNLVVAYANKKFAKFPLSQYATDGNKLLFKKGLNDKEAVEYIEAIEKDKKINVFGHEIDTKDIKEFGSRTAQGGKIKGIK